MSNNGRIGGMVWAAAWFAGACIFYFVLIPMGIKEPSYATQSPTQFPRLMVSIIGLLAALLFFLEWRGYSARTFEKISPWFFATPAIAGVYALILEPLGFPLATIGSLAALLVVFGERRPRIFLGVACITAVSIHVVFVYFLHIPLPRGILG